MEKKLIKTEGYPKWIYVNPSCQECDKRIAIGEIPNSSYPFIFGKQLYCSIYEIIGSIFLIKASEFNFLSINPNNGR